MADDVSAPPAKKRKLSSIFKDSFVSKPEVFEHLEDVTFIVGNERCGIERIGGNRTIFAIHSQVLQAQLFGKMKEAVSDEIVIDDITPQAFKFLKQLFYVKEEKLNVDIVVDVLFASKKYLLVDLECECYKFIETVRTLEDWWKLIIQQRITTDIDMEAALIRKSQVLIQNSEKIGQDSDKLCQLSPEWMAKLVQSSSFMIEKEENVWQICLKYCQDRIASENKWEEYKIDEKSNCNNIDNNDSSNDNNKANVSEMMNKYLSNIFDFQLWIKDGETKYQICKTSFVAPIKGEAPYKYDTSSPYCWYPRKPYYQFFFAGYDIRMLKNGDEVGFPSEDGSYRKYKIDTIDWLNHDSKSAFGSKGIKFAQFDVLVYQNWCVNDSYTASGSCFLSLDGLSINIKNSNSANRKHKYKYKLVQPTSADRSMYQVGMKVEWKKNEDMDWRKGKITRIDKHNKNPTAMIVVDDERQFHPWNFDCLRPLSNRSGKQK